MLSVLEKGDLTGLAQIKALQCEARITKVMMPNSWAAEPDVSFGVDRPLTGGDELARERAVTEVGMEERGRRVTLRPSILPLFTRLSISSARSSADSLSTWIILEQKEREIERALSITHMDSKNSKFLHKTHISLDRTYSLQNTLQIKAKLKCV